MILHLVTSNHVFIYITVETSFSLVIYIQLDTEIMSSRKKEFNSDDKKYEGNKGD